MEDKLQTLALDTIRPDPKQPRKHFDEASLNALAESIKSDGLLEPIMVRPVKGGFMLIHGERRFRATRIAGLDSIRAVVHDANEAEAYRLSAIENIQRSNLTAIEEARVYQNFIDGGKTQAEIGEIFGKKQSVISHKLTLLTLPEGLSYYAEVNALSEAHIRQILRFKGVYGAELTHDFSGLPDTMTDAGMFINALRPFENAFEYAPFAAMSPTIKPIVTDACARFHEYVLRHNTVPQWAITAFWFASRIVQWHCSVVNVSREIDALQRLYEAELWQYELYEGGKERYSERDELIYWSIYGDMRHSGSIDERTDKLKPETRIKTDNSNLMLNVLRDGIKAGGVGADGEPRMTIPLPFGIEEALRKYDMSQDIIDDEGE
jgi:ParB/RepB/Spo0J family partition protein